MILGNLISNTVIYRRQTLDVRDDSFYRVLPKQKIFETPTPKELSYTQTKHNLTVCKYGYLLYVVDYGLD